MDAARRSTDQEVGCSSRPGRAGHTMERKAVASYTRGVPTFSEASMPEVVHAGLDRWGDVIDLLGVSGETGCFCQPWRGFDTKARSDGKTRPQLLEEQMRTGPPSPGYLAYHEDLAVGWVGVSVRTETPRLVSSRTIPWIDDEPYWSIGCFQVRPGHRRQGIARSLLDGVIADARRSGAPGVEAYPIDPQGERVEVGAGYVGVASMFDAAGFSRILITDAHSGRLPRLLVRLGLAD